MQPAYKTPSDESISTGGKSPQIVSTCDAALRFTSLESIQQISAPELVKVQSMLLHGDKLGLWETPDQWAPFIQKSLRKIDLWRRITDFIPQEYQSLFHPFSNISLATTYGKTRDSTTHAPAFQILNGAVISISRYLILCRIGPAGIGKRGKGGPLDVTSLMHLAYHHMPALLAGPISRLLIASQSTSVSAASGVHADIESAKHFSQIIPSDLLSLTPHTRENALVHLKRLEKFRDIGLWHETLQSALISDRPTKVSGPAEPIDQERLKQPHLPLPDDFVSHMGTCSLWLTEELSGSILEVATSIRSIFNEFEHQLPQLKGYHQYLARIAEYLKNFKWTDSRGVEITNLPFNISLKKRVRKAHSSRQDMKSGLTPSGSWPPKNLSQFIGLMNTLQAAHLFIASMSMAARRSEILNLRRDCLKQSSNGSTYAVGRTFKLVDAFEGVERDWVLPNAAVKAIEQQKELVCIAEKIGLRNSKFMSTSIPSGNHLWAQLGTSPSSRRTEPLIEISKALVKYAESLGLNINPGGQRVRTHRIRKTIARLVALALVEAPKILMHVFGHKSIEMTLTYILSDDDLRADMEIVARDLRVMRAKDAIETMIEAENCEEQSLQFGGYGGPAALTLQRTVLNASRSVRESGEKWGASNALELASILTLNGNAWQLVRQGVICTKFAGTESGPCNKNKGYPEPASCNSLCQHRLEEGFLREDVDESISSAIEGFKSTALSKDYLVQAHWAGQIRTNIFRFTDLHEKWMTDPTVQEVLKDSPTWRSK
jgi:integrase